MLTSSHLRWSPLCPAVAGGSFTSPSVHDLVASPSLCRRLAAAGRLEMLQWLAAQQSPRLAYAGAGCAAAAAEGAAEGTSADGSSTRPQIGWNSDSCQGEWQQLSLICLSLRLCYADCVFSAFRTLMKLLRGQPRLRLGSLSSWNG